MATITSVTEEIRMESKYLDAMIKDHILTKLKRAKEGSVSKEYGIIDRVANIDEIIDSRINPADASNCFTIKYSFSATKLRRGSILTGKIAGIYEEGFFVVGDKYQILGTNGRYVPSTKSSEVSYVCDHCARIFSIGNVVDVTLTEITYRDLGFFGVGTHGELIGSSSAAVAATAI